MKVPGFLLTAKNWTVKHSPDILTGFGVAGMIVAVVSAVKVTPLAKERLEKIKEEHDPEDKKGIAKDVVTKVAPLYLPTAGSMIASAACSISATKIENKRNAVLAAAYTLSETTLKEYQNKVIETIGERKNQTIKDEIAKDNVAANPVVDDQIFSTGHGSDLCYDYISGRYFYSDYESLRRAVNTINNQLNNEIYVALNDLYYEIGLPSIGLGDELGFNRDDGLLDFEHPSTILTPDNRPCLVLKFTVGPRYGYADFGR